MIDAIWSVTLAFWKGAITMGTAAVVCIFVYWAVYDIVQKLRGKG